MTPAEDGPEHTEPSGFTLHLDNFEGPFDLLLQLIAKHELDITEVALSRVTDEFIAHIKAAGAVWDLEKTSHFLVVAATLLDLKAARLLPDGEIEGEEDLALLEARDLLFARLLQYRAFKHVSFWMAEVLATEQRRYARPGGLEPQFARLLPEVRLRVTPDRLAALAASAMAPKQAAQVSLTHLHAPKVSVREQAELLIDRLRLRRTLSFRALIADSPDRITTVCRFLALLELFRERAVVFEQDMPLAELVVRWTGSDTGELDISDEFDETDPESAPDRTQDDTEETIDG
ncbi:segregation and condensation protein A [Granulicoccus sp. GXG6511]|uniref:segregation and condensation protein A n=1 Tax=Granulicoccus sp. GXG6511 TaxID=3381351 RepID=UPI003D7DB198